MEFNKTGSRQALSNQIISLGHLFTEAVTKSRLFTQTINQTKLNKGKLNWRREKRDKNKLFYSKLLENKSSNGFIYAIDSRLKC